MQMTVFLSILLALGVIIILLPLARRQTSLSEVDDADFFRARLKEIERDQVRGVIEVKEAEDAKIEASRALLAAQSRQAEAGAHGSYKRRRAAAVAAVALIPIVSLSLYFRFGSPSLYDVPFAQRAVEIRNNTNLGTMIAQVEKRLEEKPDDGVGWATIAPVYADLGRYDDAVKAFKNAITYLGETADLRSALGEARLAAAEGVVTIDARADFDRSLVLDPKNLRALYYRAVAMEQDGKKDDALAAFRALLPLVQSDGDASNLVKSRIAEIEGKSLQKDFAPDADQAAMIRAMVERLDQRLQADGSDVDGWARLMRAYQVMGDVAKAEDALARAERALDGNLDALAKLKQSADELGLKN